MSSAGLGAKAVSRVSQAWLTGSWLVVVGVRIPPILPRFGVLFELRVFTCWSCPISKWRGR